VGNREPDRAQARPTLGHHSGPLETHGVEHGDEVSVEDLLTLRVLKIALRRAVAAGVEPDVATEGAQPSAETDETGVLREEIDRVGDVQEHQVKRPFAARLVGKIRPVSRARVVDLGGGGHRSTFWRKNPRIALPGTAKA
jgi:hypothetical protein